jgi:excisionase family DNA binding protein
MRRAITMLAIPQRRLYPLAEAIQLLGISRAQVYVIIARGELHAKKVGKLTMIPATSIDAYIDSLPEAS